MSKEEIRHLPPLMKLCILFNLRHIFLFLYVIAFYIFLPKLFLYILVIYGLYIIYSYRRIIRIFKYGTITKAMGSYGASVALNIDGYIHDGTGLERVIKFKDNEGKEHITYRWRLLNIPYSYKKNKECTVVFSNKNPAKNNFVLDNLILEFELEDS